MNVRSVPLLLLLALLTACYSGHRREMLALLDEADSLNRAYAQMPSDTLLRQAADFFDRHGSRNERVRAHYLLGCAYRDLGQAPEALQCYQDAVDCADTTVRDSLAAHLLMVVYGQMAELYIQQNLPHDYLKASEAFGRYALQARDTFSYIRNIELQAKPYYLLRDTAKMYEAFDTARQLYEKHGMARQAISILGLTIHINIEKGNYNEARKQIDLFENQSGLFDSYGNISPDRTSYYYTKGLYYFCINQLDSAEEMMRRVLPQIKSDGCKGLLNIYHKRRNTDSIVKYAMLYEAALDSQTMQRSIETVHQMTSLYNYQQVKSRADQEALFASRRFNIMLAILFFALSVIITLVYLYQKRSREQDIAYRNYIANLRELRAVQQDIANYRNHEQEYQEIIHLKQEEVKQLEEKIDTYEKLHHRKTSTEERFLSSEAYLEFKNKIQNIGYKLSEEDFKLLEEALFENFPEFMRFVESHRLDLTDYELKIVVFTRAHFMKKVIASLTGISNTTLSHKWDVLMRKLFHTSGNAKDFEHRIMNLS